MKYDKTAQQALHLAQVQADRTIAGIGDRLCIEDLDTASAAILAERVAEGLRALPADGRRAALVNTALSLVELEEVCRSLNTHRDEVGEEIRRVSCHNTATTAYRRGWKVAASKT